MRPNKAFQISTHTCAYPDSLQGASKSSFLSPNTTGTKASDGAFLSRVPRSCRRHLISGERPLTLVSNLSQVMKSVTDRGWHSVLTYVHLRLPNEEVEEAIPGVRNERRRPYPGYPNAECLSIEVVKRTRASLVSPFFPFLHLAHSRPHRALVFAPSPLLLAKTPNYDTLGRC